MTLNKPITDEFCVSSVLLIDLTSAYYYKDDSRKLSSMYQRRRTPDASPRLSFLSNENLSWDFFHPLNTASFGEHGIIVTRLSDTHVTTATKYPKLRSAHGLLILSKLWPCPSHTTTLYWISDNLTTAQHLPWNSTDDRELQGLINVRSRQGHCNAPLPDEN